jgi:hypothetical protein
MTCNLVSVLKACTFCLSTLLIGCADKIPGVEEKMPGVEEKIPQVVAQAPAPPPFDGREEFQKVVEYLKSSIPPRISWFSMNQENKQVFESATFDKQAFEKGVLKGDGSYYDLHLLNYDWDPARKEGVLYWQCGHYLDSVPLVYRFVYRVTLYESNGKLKVAKIEEKYGKADGQDVKTLVYDTEIVHYKPASNLSRYWDLILENYNK